MGDQKEMGSWYSWNKIRCERRLAVMVGLPWGRRQRGSSWREARVPQVHIRLPQHRWVLTAFKDFGLSREQVNLSVCCSKISVCYPAYHKKISSTFKKVFIDVRRNTSETDDCEHCLNSCFKNSKNIAWVVCLRNILCHSCSKSMFIQSVRPGP